LHIRIVFHLSDKREGGKENSCAGKAWDLVGKSLLNEEEAYPEALEKEGPNFLPTGSTRDNWEDFFCMQVMERAENAKEKGWVWERSILKTQQLLLGKKEKAEISSQLGKNEREQKVRPQRRLKGLLAALGGQLGNIDARKKRKARKKKSEIYPN